MIDPRVLRLEKEVAQKSTAKRNEFGSRLGGLSVVVRNGTQNDPLGICRQLAWRRIPDISLQRCGGLGARHVRVLLPGELERVAAWHSPHGRDDLPTCAPSGLLPLRRSVLKPHFTTFRRFYGSR